MPVAYSYIRFSHHSQSEGHSLERQTAAAAEWCKRNGMILDEATTFRDLGKSAYYPDTDLEALGGFLEFCIELDGLPRRILPGSFLIIENLDRLSRKEERKALRLWMDILDAGINIVQLEPEIIWRHDKCDMIDIFRAIMDLSRGHAESSRKSSLIGPAWAKKKKEAREKGLPLTSVAPPWLRLSDGEYREVTKIADIYRRIFRLSIEGISVRSIAHVLISEQIPRPDRLIKRKKTKGCEPQWTANYIQSVLCDRRLIGEHELRARAGRAWKKTGETIPGLYPAIISEDEWALARESCRMRQRDRGRSSPRAVNIFKGLLFDSIDGGTYAVISRRSRKDAGFAVLENTNSRKSKAKSRSFSYPVFEYVILSQLKEVPLRDVLGTDKAGERLEGLLEKSKKKGRRKKEIEEALTDGEAPISGLAKAHAQLEAEIAELDEEIARERTKVAAKNTEEWQAGMGIAERLRAEPDNARLRSRLHSILQRHIEGIWIVCGGVKKGRVRYCAAQVEFKDTGRHRTYIMWHRPKQVAVKSRINRREAFFAETDVPNFKLFNLRKADSASRLLTDLRNPRRSPSASDWRAFPPPIPKIP